MSLIEEALRRIQDPLLAKHDAIVQAPPKSAPAPEPPPPATQHERRAGPAHSWQTVFPPLPLPAASVPSANPFLLAVSLSVLALTAVIVIGGAFWIGYHMVMRPTPIVISEPPTPPAQAPRAHRPVGPEAPEATPEPPQPQREKHARMLSVSPAASPATSTDLVISGVVEGMGESYAVINGLIVGVGERVGDATVLNVANGVVTLRRKNGEDVVLSVPR